MKDEKILVILGPTATGKTDVAINLAKKMNGAIIACDSRQVFTGLDIGSGKYPNEYKNIEKKHGKWIVDGIEIYLYDVISPNENYSVSQYVKDAEKIIEEIINNKKLPIIVGGTGLYLKALLEGLPNVEVYVNFALRKQLESLDKQQLQEKLKEVDISKWETMNNSDRQNPRRLIRYIEIALSGGNLEKQKSKKYKNVLKIGLIAPREFLYKKVDLRVINRLGDGMLEEANNLIKKGLTIKRFKELGLEYGVLADYLEGKIAGLEGEKGLIKTMQGKIHGYVRRQLTWFKKEENVVWVDINEDDYMKKLEKIVFEWYYYPDAKEN